MGTSHIGHKAAVEPRSESQHTSQHQKFPVISSKHQIFLSRGTHTVQYHHGMGKTPTADIPYVTSALRLKRTGLPNLPQPGECDEPPKSYSESRGWTCTIRHNIQHNTASNLDSSCCCSIPTQPKSLWENTGEQSGLELLSADDDDYGGHIQGAFGTFPPERNTLAGRTLVVLKLCLGFCVGEARLVHMLLTPIPEKNG